MAKKLFIKKAGKPSSSPSALLYVAIGVMLAAFLVYYLVQLWKPREHFEAAPAKVTLIYSESCGHCHNFLPVFDEVCQKKDELKLKISCQKFQGSDPGAAEYASKVSGVPAIFITDAKGKETHLVGFRTKEQFIDELTKTV